ncbi:MAG: hypothetical protein GEU95_01675 [Rhizobiales bacterium]|nr:hypothetical protein [Hyphomicrobiales bacterium]
MSIIIPPSRAQHQRPVVAFAPKRGSYVTHKYAMFTPARRETRPALGETLMAITIVTPPASLPVTVAEAKTFGHIVDDDEDELIENLIAAARDHVEQATGRIMVATEFLLSLDCFPRNEVRLPRSPLIEVASVTYDDTDGIERTLSPTLYTVDTSSEPGWIVPTPTTRWPATYDGINAVRIQFISGYVADDNSPPDLAAHVPARAKIAVKSLVAHWYDTRTPISDKGWHVAPYTMDRLLNGLRVWRL